MKSAFLLSMCTSKPVYIYCGRGFLTLTYIFYNYYLGINRLIVLVGRVFANGPGDLGSIPGRVIPNT